MDATEMLSVIVPAYNEAQALPEFHRRLSAVLNRLGLRCEVIYVNDGSRDETQKLINQLCNEDTRAASVELSRNFGKEAAMTAGLDYARGDAVVIIDADLQDPPELIVQLVARWREGYDVVYARRTSRSGETWLKKATAAAFYRLIKQISRVEIPADTGDFRLMNRRAVDSLLQLREQHRFMKGLFAWIGYKQIAVDYERDPRVAGETKFNYWKLWNFALEGITSFTIAPLKIATYLGLLTSGLAFIFGAWIIYQTLAFGNPVAGYPSLMVVVLFLGGIQLFFIGIIGEYLGRVYGESKQRPLYFVQKYQPPKAGALNAMPVSEPQSIQQVR
ncbi:MAG: glycosyltransferase family 2 protein [Burkholderiales bacterium]